ncbi:MULTISPECIES: dUTP diphosphatase [unclassified Paenibacillus]|uniref:dUTP diphosphatase n=1 Tax=unclassified Paenibacillus TaxID=185978 RepID=UPI0030F5E345
MSTLTLEQMYEMQKVLDARIIKEKGLEGVNLLPNTVLALQVEIGELANEWRGFKHWSKNQKSRTRAVRNLGVDDIGVERGEAYNPLLEEYVDCLHFFLSIARQLNLPADDLYIPDDVAELKTVVLFTEILHNVGMIIGGEFLVGGYERFKDEQRHFFRGALACFYSLGEQRLGFSFEQITEAYTAKNKVNHDRQSNGY